MVRRLVRIAILGWLVGAGVQWARRTGGLVPKVQRLIRRGDDAPATAPGRAGAKGLSPRTKETSRAELAAAAAREAASVRRAGAPVADTGSAVEATAEAGPAAAAEAEPAVEAASAAEAAPGPEAPAGDDLKIIEGIGPRIEAVLHEAGVTSFEGLADQGTEGIETILRDAGVRASPGTWPDQARLAANGEWDALAEMQAQLKGGREARPD